MGHRPQLVRAMSRSQQALAEDKPWEIVGMSLIARDSGLVTASAYRVDLVSRRLVHQQLVDRQVAANTREALGQAILQAAAEFALDLQGEPPLPW